MKLQEDWKRTKDMPIIISGYKVEYDRLADYIEKKAIPVLCKPLDIEGFEKNCRIFTLILLIRRWHGKEGFGCR